MSQIEQFDPTVSAREARLRHVTVVSVDVVESMLMSSSMSIEDWWIVIERLFTVVAEGVHRFGGYIENFAGDGVIAVFGIDPDRSDHAVWACAAALWLREEAQRYTAAIQEARGIELSLRIGVNSGDAMFGSVGHGAISRVVAVGHAVGMAARIESLADPGTVYVSEQTARLAGDVFELLDVGTFDVRGAPAAVALFELLSWARPTADERLLRTHEVITAAGGIGWIV